MPREAETKVDKLHGNQTRQVSNQGPDQWTTHGQIDGQELEYEAEQ